MKFTNLEKLLPFGYFILVVLGIVKESVFYYFIGINILKYSSIMDVLISPIADLTAHPIVLIAIGFYVGVIYFLFNLAKRRQDMKWARKLASLKEGDEPLNQEELAIRLGNKFISVISVIVVLFFVGIGIGNGYRVSKAIKDQTYTLNRELTFDGNEKKKVFLIGLNSLNYFYIEQGNSHIKISPVGAIKEIEYLNKK